MCNPFEQSHTIHFVDIGCSGNLNSKWAGLFPFLSYTGFDPNAEECERLGKLETPYQTCRYLPIAIAGESGPQTLYKTQSLFCYSLLRPRHEFLKRFDIADLLEETGTETVQCTTLDALAERDNLRADIIKVDAQGLDLHILKAGEKLLTNAFCIETENAFVPLYVQEPTFSEMDEFMRDRGFFLFDISTHHRIARKNPLADRGKHQPLWCEALWLYDHIGQARVPTREQALKCLVICKALEFFDFGVELSDHFGEAGIIDPEMVAYLRQPQNWAR